MSDDDLEKFSHEVDNILTDLLLKYKQSPLIMAAIIVARLAHLNVAADSTEDFKMLMVDIATKDLPKPKSPKVH